MKSGIHKILTFMALLLSVATASAQTASGGTDGSTYLVYLLVGAAVLIFLYLILQVSDNLLAIEAKQSGVDGSGANFGVFPRADELIRPKMPKYVNGASVKTLKKGHDILLEGEAAKDKIEEAHITTYAVQPPNFRGIKPIPKMEVEEGDKVKAGDVLFYDKPNPDIKYVSPVSGEVISVKRGEKRAIVEVVISADREQQYKAMPDFDLANSSREALVAHLMESGCWPLINQRPYDVVADPNVVPRDIFISTFDTAPLAPDLNFVVKGQEAAFQKGLDALALLTSGQVRLGLNARGAQAPAAAFTEAANVKKYWFHGPHPAGNVGVQIHHIAPINAGDTIWTLNVQAVITVGNLLLQNRYNAERIVALTGAELKAPKYVRTKLGANIGELLGSNVAPGNVRYISGDVLSGDQVTTQGFLNAQDDQVTVVAEGDYYELFGWLLPLSARPSISNTFPTKFMTDTKFKADTNTHGEKRAFVVSGQYESVLPMDIYPQHLMKAIIVSDFERMEALGLYELSEEDVALCEFVCTSKQPLQKILREGLDMALEQG